MQAKTLFSQHYLTHRLPDHPEWKEDPRPAFDAVRDLWRKARRFGESWNEAQTEEEFIKPVLRLLGWSYIVQTKTGKGGRVSRPDYALFADDKTRNEAYPYQGQDDPFYRRALAIAEAKYWGRPLNQKDTTGRDTWKADSNPSFQMVNYLVGTRVPWGILTNGILWRLYSREVSSTASEFYEVDLGVIFDFLPPDGEPSSEQLDQFRRWWLFFRRDAFLPDAQGKSFVQRVHEGSATYARQISDKLKELVFEQVMPEIAGGFIAYRYHRMGIREETPETLRQIYQASLSLLYKLLFLFYAEARGLLPITNPGYREQSLTALAQWAAERLDNGLPLSDAPYATPKYDALLALFRRIDQGDPSLGIPRYNGGLFNPQNPENQFLESHRLSDRVVARALDIMARDAGEPVDYAYISVRNLGAIYEGLLEYKLRVVDPAGGKVELVTDRGERKATGSYYTPDYIVNYIVQHTLEPILDEREQAFREAMDRCADLRRKLQRASDPATIGTLREQLDGAERDAREAFLGIKVLDPAMGSGHFLVNAVDFLTDGIIRRMQAYHDDHPDVPWTWNPIQQLIERVRREILAEMERQGVEVDRARLDDTAILTRLVMKRCIYGVDLNRMAVELAKVSLWLHSFTVGAPLSFLDHHLRWGNSLIGTDVRTVEREIRGTRQEDKVQLSLFAGPFAGLLDLTGLMVEVAEQADATLADVQHSAGVFEEFQRQLTPYKQVLDLWVSQYFGNRLARHFLIDYGNNVLPALKGEKEVPETHRETVARARELWQEKRFFHWDLEFPEVFIDLRKRDWAENPGFDAVIGNPPWGGEIPNADKEALRTQFRTALAPAIDSYALFTELAILRAKQGGHCGYITPDTVLRKDDLLHLREFLLSSALITEIVETGPLFQEVRDTWCLILLLAKGQLSKKHKVRHRQIDRFIVSSEARLEKLGQRQWSKDSLVPQQHWASRPNLIIGYLASEDEQKVIRAIERYSNPLVTHPLGFDISRGEEGSKFSLEHEPGSNWKMVLPQLVERHWVGEGFPVPASSLTPNKLMNYYAHPKIWVIRIQKLRWRQRLVAAFDPRNNSAGMKTLQIIVSRTDNQQNLLYLSALLDSRLMNFWCTDFLVDDMNQSYLERLPIRRVAFTTPADERARRVEEGKTLAEAWVAARQGEVGEDGRCVYPFPQFLNDDLGRWLQERLSPVHNPDPELVRQHNAAPMNRAWQLPEEGPGEQSDVVHDLLAHLAENMLRMNREKQDEIRGFLAWLEREIGTSLENLTGHSRLRDYPGDYQKGEMPLSLEDVLEILRRNRRRLKVDPGGRAFQERLEKEYQASLAKLLPLKRQMAATDRLIDLIVYRLYGLTEEEVRIVEESLTARSPDERGSL